MYTPTWTRWEDTDLAQSIKRFQDKNYYKLNDLYLDIQSGRVELTRREYNLLNEYLNSAYGGWDSRNPNRFMMEKWQNDFYKLPGWLNV